MRLKPEVDCSRAGRSRGSWNAPLAQLRGLMRDEVPGEALFFWAFAKNSTEFGTILHLVSRRRKGRRLIVVMSPRPGISFPRYFAPWLGESPLRLRANRPVPSRTD